ncbi:unnamed protein product [Coffea canephora]|uniref:Uncharacterized protein n=1 Tax=Coffea canephora TaxID=49390 RepID=A0A068V306_COFCA|nr:unnamed protein product [Coffea canephora]
MEGSSSKELVTYRPPEEFEEVEKDALIELNLDDSKELWLIQWTVNQTSDLNGQQVSLKFHHDGHLGSFEGSSGKLYDVVSFKLQDPEVTRNRTQKRLYSCHQHQSLESLGRSHGLFLYCIIRSPVN